MTCCIAVAVQIPQHHPDTHLNPRISFTYSRRSINPRRNSFVCVRRRVSLYLDPNFRCIGYRAEVRERLLAKLTPREVSDWLEANAPVVLRTQPAFVREIIVGVLGGVLPDARVRSG